MSTTRSLALALPLLLLVACDVRLGAGPRARSDAGVAADAALASLDARAASLDGGGPSMSDAGVVSACAMGCPSNAHCVEELGASHCTCDPGYHANGTSCAPDGSSDPCAGMDCGRHGACETRAGITSCRCEVGFHLVAGACVADSPGPCAGVTCSGHGGCDASSGTATCLCSPGYEARGLECVAVVIEPCHGVTCGGHGTCAPFGGRPLCTCESGFTSTGADCVPADGPNPCATVDCNGHGSCYVEEVTGVAACRCDEGFYAHISSTNCQPSAGTLCEHESCGVGTCRLWPLGPSTGCICPTGYLPHGNGCMRVERTHCRDIDGTLRERGEMRCSADDRSVEICRDEDDDGDAEWVVTEACDGACSTTDCVAHAGECLTQSDCPNGTVCITGDHGTMWGVGRCMTACDCSNCGNCDASDFSSYGTEYCGATEGSTEPTIACHAPCPGSGGCIPFGSVSVCWNIEGCFDAGDPP